MKNNTENREGLCGFLRPAGLLYLGRVARFNVRRASRKLRWVSWFGWRTAVSWVSINPVGSQSRGYGLERCEVRYINIAARVDRRAQIEQQFIGLRLEAVRIDAVAAKPGILGCAQSHVKALSDSLPPGKALMVCEDDLVFLLDRSKVDHLVEEFLENSALDILCLAYNLRARPLPISQNLQITDDTQTTACYIIKPSAIATLRDCFSESVVMLLGGESPKHSALDIVWKKLQAGKLIFSVPRQRAGHQRPGYSDIAGGFVDYGV